MNVAAPAPDDTVKLGLLLEAAEAQQRLAESSLAALHEQLNGLDHVVRDEVRETLITELGALTSEAAQAASILARLRRVMDLRVALWTVLMTGLPALTSVAALWHWMPSAQELAARRSQLAQLQSAVRQLEGAGGSAQLQRCGPSARLCVRVDVRAGAFGSAGDYRVVAGY